MQPILWGPYISNSPSEKTLFNHCDLLLHYPEYNFGKIRIKKSKTIVKEDAVKQWSDAVDSYRERSTTSKPKKTKRKYGKKKTRGKLKQ